MAKMEGTDDGRDFALPFDATDAKTKLVRLVMNLHLAGPGSVTLSDVKLVQYPDASTPASQPPATLSSSQTAHTPVQVTTVPATPSGGINWKSFLLGVAATGVSLLFGGGIIFISRRWQRRRHERELRRIASLDS
jgi:hypothetical protein